MLQPSNLATGKERTMSFIDANDPSLVNLVGQADGARRIFLFRLPTPQGLCAGLHRHGGDEAIHVISGEIQFLVHGERKVCRAGEIAFVPPETLHGFTVLEDAVIEVFGEQEMGEYVTIVEPDGSRHEVEVFVAELPWDRRPPDGRHTPLDELMQIMESTRKEVTGK
jgi:quercetin dioxygenase-like cupin family protein